MQIGKRQIANGFAWILFLHTAAFCLYWLTNRLYYQAVNDYLADLLGARFDFVFSLVLFSAALWIWSAARLVLPLLGRPLRGRWLLRGVTIFYLLLFYGSFGYLFSEDPVQVARLGQLLAYFGLVWSTLLLMALAVLLRPLAHRPGAGRSRHLLPTAALAIFWLAGLLVLPANIQGGSLPLKPKLLAHRGASQLAPENTLSAAQRAAQEGAFGLEADFRISLDGVPFLMHDDTLLRTTDIMTVFPARQTQRAETFRWDELQRLSAGQWFVSQDPAGTIASGLVSPQDAAHYATEPVPSLAQMLPVVKQSHLTYIFDIEPAPSGHPYGAQLFALTLQQLLDAGLGSQVWFLAEPAQVAGLKAAAPGMKLAAGIDSLHPPAAAELVAQGYQVVNGEYSLSATAIQAYHAAGLWVNLWTVDEPWQFSRLWLLGVESVTTNNLQNLAGMQAPIFSMNAIEYLLIWVIFGLLSLVLLFVPRLGPSVRFH